MNSKIKFLSWALTALLMCANFTSCSSDDDEEDELNIETSNAPVSITLSPETLTLEVGEEATIEATVKNYKDLSWYSSDNSIVSINSYYYYDYYYSIPTTITITARKVGTATITLRADETSKSVTVTVKKKEYPYKVPEAVDLGLSVKWANINLGATSPEDYGYYFAWGEIDPKEEYRWNTYVWGNDDNELTKYVTNSDYSIVDNKTELEADDDAATVNLGSNWQIPSIKEWEELMLNCTWEWQAAGNTTFGGVAGYEVTSNKEGYTEDKSIFLPAAGYRSGAYLDRAGSRGYYWSRSLDTKYSDYARYLSYDSGSVYTGSGDRSYGRSVRAVQRKK